MDWRSDIGDPTRFEPIYLASLWHSLSTQSFGECTFEQEFDAVGIVSAKLQLASAVKNCPPLTTQKREVHSNVDFN